MPAAGIVHVRGDRGDILYDTGVHPGLELEVVPLGMALVSDLGGEIGMPSGGSHHQLSLMEGAAHRFLKIDMLPLIEGEHSDREVGMVRNSGGDSIEFVPTLVKHLAIITEPLGLRIHSEYLLALGPVYVHIAKGDDINHSGVGEIIDYLLTAVAYTDKRYLYLLAFRLGSGHAANETLLAKNLSRRERHAGRSHSHGLEEISSVKHILVLLLLLKDFVKYTKKLLIHHYRIILTPIPVRKATFASLSAICPIPTAQ